MARQAATIQDAAAPGEPKAVIVNPTSDSFVAATGGLNVTVAAEAGASLKTVTIKLDNVIVETLSFAQNEAVRVVRTVTLPLPADGAHTLVAEATDWADAVQPTLDPVSFTLDTEPPLVTLDTDLLRLADTWAQGSDVLRFRGTASDNVELVAVQIKIGDAPFVDATFGGGTWSTAQYVPDPDGQTLAVTVRAIDRSGQRSDFTGTIGVDLTPTDLTVTPPDTTVTPTTVNAGVNNVSVSFAGVAGTNEVSAFECRINGGPFQPCESPQDYDGLSNGVNTFEVRAIDTEGIVDPTPASETWTISVATLQTTISASPSDPTVSRDATFVFSGAASFQCALDAAPFTTCTSPKSYTGLSDGEHTFQVRGVNGANTGAATRFTWTVNNAAPVAEDQSVATTAGNDIAIPLVATDVDPLTYDVESPAHGLLSGIPPALTYTPDTGFAGTDSFTFVANDGQVDSNVATVNITVDGVTVAPVAADDAYSTNQDTVLTVAAPGVLANDSGASVLTAVLDSGPTNGTLTLNGDGSVVYTPTAGFFGSDSFTYRANDGVVDSNIATVTITVNEVTIAPVAADDAYSTNQDTVLTVAAPGVLANDSGASVLTAVLDSGPTNGTLTLTGDGSVVYTPTAGFFGSDSFTYRATDGTADSNVATVTIAVNEVNNDSTPPTIIPQVVGTAGSDGWYVGDVSLSWSVVDGESAITDQSGCDPVTVNTETAGQAFTCSATSSGGTAAESVTIKLDKTAPETTLTAQPSDPSSTADATFEFTAADSLSGVASFECSLDGAAFNVCGSPQSYSGLADGSHTFQVVAIDSAGNRDATPASYTWTVESSTLTEIATCGPITVYRDDQGQLVAPGWTGTIKLGTNGRNTINGGNGPDLILGMGGNDRLDGKGGDDLICGGDGVDRLSGSSGNDYLDGGSGNDVLNGGSGDFDSLVGGEGNDVLLDGDGVISALGGPGNDAITIALRNGWRDRDGQARFTGLAAGYGNDTVGLAILNLTRFFVDITGDERDEPPSPQEGSNDKLVLAGLIDSASVIIKFERRIGGITVSAEGELPTDFTEFEVDPTTLTDESGDEFLTEAVGGDEPVEEGGQEVEMAYTILLPIVSR